MYLRNLENKTTSYYSINLGTYFKVGMIERIFLPQNNVSLVLSLPGKRKDTLSFL